MNIRFNPNSFASLCRSVPCGHPIGLKDRLYSTNIRLCKAIGHPQGAPLQWVL